MTVKQFLKSYSGSPIDADELAELASEHLGNDPIGQAARTYTYAKDDFFALLEAAGYEHG